MRPEPVKAPTPKQKLILRFMIVIGLCCTFFLMYSLFKRQVISYKPLYWLLVTTFVFTAFKIFYEWYHYWSISVPRAPAKSRDYTVDIFTTFCPGEPYEMIEETLTAIQAITYPHETYLCDEADDPYLRDFCGKLRVHHVTRKDRKNAKAGNINNALKQSSGELCLVLDPDHIPLPEFLDPIVSHFDDPKVGYVQVVQAYYNQDTGYIAKGAAQQTYQFYGPMMMTMNSYGTAQAIGANCTFRRAALDSIGGHAAGLAEDMHTAMQLHAKGWKSVYVPMVLSLGLVPATLSAYFKQQLKWSRGVFELLVTSYIKLFRQFTWRQKLHYGLAPMFYLSGFVFLINFLIPIISLFSGVFPLQMDFSNFAIISIPFVTSVILIRLYVQRWVMNDHERGFHIAGGLLLIGSWWVFIVGFIYTVMRKDVPYIPTPKDVKDERNLKNNLPNIIVGLVSLAAIVYALYTDFNPYTVFMSCIAGLNCAFMVFIIIAGEELKLQEIGHRRARLGHFIKRFKYVKGLFWLFRRRIYSGIRTASVMFVVLSVCFCLYLYTGMGGHFLRTLPVYQTLSSKFEQLLVSGRRPFVDPRIAGARYLKIQPPPTATAARVAQDNNASIVVPNYADNVRGVIYRKGNYWYKNIFALTKKTIESDFNEIKTAGFNTVKIYGPTIYDNSILDVAKHKQLNVTYGFWITDAYNFVNDAARLDATRRQILKTIRRQRANSAITAWNLGNTSYQQLDHYYNGPALEAARQNYIVWLKQLVAAIKKIDPSRQVSVDIAATTDAAQAINALHQQIPLVNAFGLEVQNKQGLNVALNEAKAPYFFSDVRPAAFQKADYPAGGIFYSSWQDQQTAWSVTLNGLKDIWGRNKPDLYKISGKWNHHLPVNNLPPIRILNPAQTVVSGKKLTYNALVYEYNKWNLAPYLATGLSFKWYLVGTDQWGNPNVMYWAGDGPVITLPIPDEPQYYRLYLIASKENNVTEAFTTLNLPLNRYNDNYRNMSAN